MPVSFQHKTMRQSSKRRYRQYLEQRKVDKTYARRESDAKGIRPDRRARSRPFRELLSKFWGFMQPHRGSIAFALTTLTIVCFTALAMPAATKIVIDHVLTPGGMDSIPGWMREAGFEGSSQTKLLYAVGAGLIGLALIGVTLGSTGRWQMTRVTKRVQIELRDRAFSHAIKLPLVTIQRYKSGGMASLLREDSGLAGELLFGLVYNPWKAVVQLVGTLVILAVVDWRMLIGGLMLIPAAWISQRAYISRIRPLYRDAKHVRQDVDATTTEVFGGMRIVRGFGRERTEVSRFTGGQHYMTRLEILTWWWSRVVEIAWSILIPTASAAVLVYGGTQVLKGALTIGDLMMFSTYLLMLLGPMETLTHTASQVQSNLAAFDRLLDLLAEPTEFADAPGMRVVDRKTARGEIELRDVWFAYPKPKPRAKEAETPEPPPVIRGVSLKVKAGETIAFIGPSGSGKTTLCNLICRFYDPTSGVVMFDGVDLKSISASSYRSMLGIVEQDVFLFDGTIRENIAYGRRDATEAEIVAAANASNAAEFIEAMDLKYETVIGERGVRLSGGQKQRIAIARALLADPRILILDEATSNLDTESERLIQRSLVRLMKGRTCFVIAHRLSTVRLADRIVVLEQGAITEQGTHDELIARDGRYADLLKMQTHRPDFAEAV